MKNYRDYLKEEYQNKRIKRCDYEIALKKQRNKKVIMLIYSPLYYDPRD